MNKMRILSIGGVAFFTTLTGLLTSEAIFSLSLSMTQLVGGALIVAGIQAGLAICQEIKIETDTKSKGMKRSMLFLM